MLDVLQRVIERFRNECLVLHYEVILEADVSGWLFYLLMMEVEVNPRELHLDTRVCAADGRYDVAVGPLRTGADGRPCVQPQLVIEVKIFPRLGFTDQQHRVHYEHVLNDDLPKLGRLDPAVAVRAALVVDGRGYLKGTYHGQNRREHLLSVRNRVAPGAHVFMMRLADGGWGVEHEAPL